ncbi:hypothetical protein V8F33_008234 [Rhypophila sp. PSN 637]
MRSIGFIAMAALSANIGTASAEMQLFPERAESGAGDKEHDGMPSFSLAKRAITPWGGYALLVHEASCPSATFKCDDTADGSCCPNGTFCFKGNGRNVFCCPDEDTDCTATVVRVYACANSSWDLWSSYAGNAYCCFDSEVGTRANYEDRCLPKSIPVPSSIIMTKHQQQTKMPATATQAEDISLTNTGGAPSPTGPNENSSFSPPGDDSQSGSSGGGGLPTSATIAIAVLATAVGLILIGLGLFMWYRERKHGQIKDAVAAAASSSTVPGGPGEMAAVSVQPTVAQYHDPGQQGRRYAPPAYAPPHPDPDTAQELQAQGAVSPIQHYATTPPMYQQQQQQQELDGQGAARNRMN